VIKVLQFSCRWTWPWRTRFGSRSNTQTPPHTRAPSSAARTRERQHTLERPAQVPQVQAGPCLPAEIGTCPHYIANWTRLQLPLDDRRVAPHRPHRLLQSQRLVEFPGPQTYRDEYTHIHSYASHRTVHFCCPHLCL